MHKSQEPHEEVLRAAVGVVGDLVCAVPSSKSMVKAPQHLQYINYLLQEAKRREPATKEVADWVQSELTKP